MQNISKFSCLKHWRLRLHSWTDSFRMACKLKRVSHLKCGANRNSRPALLVFQTDLTFLLGNDAYVFQNVASLLHFCLIETQCMKPCLHPNRLYALLYWGPSRTQYLDLRFCTVKCPIYMKTSSVSVVQSVIVISGAVLTVPSGIVRQFLHAALHQSFQVTMQPKLSKKNRQLSSAATHMKLVRCCVSDAVRNIQLLCAMLLPTKMEIIFTFTCCCDSTSPRKIWLMCALILTNMWATFSVTQQNPNSCRLPYTLALWQKRRKTRQNQVLRQWISYDHRHST